MKWVARLVMATVVLWIVTRLHIGITANSLGTVVVAAIILGLENAIIRPIVLLFTLPVNILTLGLFTFVVNALMLLLLSVFVPGFHVAGFGSALIGAIALSILHLLTRKLLDKR